MKFKDINILVVDDDEVTCDYLRIVLTAELANVKVVHSGKDAIEMTKQNHFDVIIMDIRMYPISGIEAKNEIKKLFPDIKIIGQSAIYLAHENPCDEFDDFFAKPFTKKQIEVSLTKVLNLT